MKYYDAFKSNMHVTGAAAIILFILYLAIALVLFPFLAFWIGYFIGWVSKIVLGKYLILAFEALNLKIVPDHLPLLGGLFGWVGSFFINKAEMKKG